jgi:hypothetical protein
MGAYLCPQPGENFGQRDPATMAPRQTNTIIDGVNSAHTITSAAMIFLPLGTFRNFSRVDKEDKAATLTYAVGSLGRLTSSADGVRICQLTVCFEIS